MLRLLLPVVLAADPEGGTTQPWAGVEDVELVPTFEEPGAPAPPSLDPRRVQAGYTASAWALDGDGRVVDGLGRGLTTEELVRIDPDADRVRSFQRSVERRYDASRPLLVVGPSLFATGVLISLVSPAYRHYGEGELFQPLLAAGLGLTAGGAGMVTAGALTHHATTVYAADPRSYAPRPALQALVDAHNASLRDALGLSGNVTFHVVVTPSSVGVEGGF